jgi:hypothetical protein
MSCCLIFLDFTTVIFGEQYNKSSFSGIHFSPEHFVLKHPQSIFNVTVLKTDWGWWWFVPILYQFIPNCSVLVYEPEPHFKRQCYMNLVISGMTLSDKHSNKMVTVHNIHLELYKTCQCAFSKFAKYANIISHVHLLSFNFNQNLTITVHLMKIYLATVKLFNEHLNLLGCDAVSQVKWFLMFQKDVTPSKCWEINDPMT